MPIRKRKPTSPGRRFQTSSDFAEVTKSKPEKALTKPKPKTGGRNSYGRMTSRHRGGGHTWENLVAACKPCNHRKGGKTLDEVRMRLSRAPFEPRSDIYSLFTPYLGDERNEAWRTYMFLGRN